MTTWPALHWHFTHTRTYWFKLAQMSSLSPGAVKLKGLCSCYCDGCRISERSIYAILDALLDTVPDLAHHLDAWPLLLHKKSIKLQRLNYKKQSSPVPCSVNCNNCPL